MNYKVSDFKDELISLEYDVFVHGCNMKGAFAAGIAGVVRSVYPDCYHTYRKGLLSHKAGDIIPHEISSGKIILNALTQVYPGPNGSYDLVDSVFKAVDKKYSNSKICFPLIGCGIAKLNWNVVSEIIDHRLNGLDYTCIVRLEDTLKYNLKTSTL